MATLNLSTAHASNYRLVFPYMTFLGDREKGDDVLLYCRTVNLPEITLENNLEVQNPYHNIKSPGDPLGFSDLEVTFAIDEAFDNYRFIHSWLFFVNNPEEFGLEVADAGIDASLHVLTSKHNPDVEFIMKSIFPKSLTAVTFDYTNETTEDLVATAVFSVNYFTMI